MNKQLKIFIASTYKDLEKERKAAIDIIQSTRHIPYGMEYFEASHTPKFELIRDIIDQSDIFILILGEKYGSIEPNTNKSYTHLEYEYAMKTKKPVFAIAMKENALDKRVMKYGKEALELDNRKQYGEFHDKVL